MTLCGKARKDGGLGVVLWIFALVITLGTAAHQRRTGPTYELAGETAIAGRTLSYHLSRSGLSTGEVEVHIPSPTTDAGAELVWRIHPDGEWTAETMQAGDGRLVGHLPPRPPLGKIEYYVLLHAGGQEARLPPADAGPLVMRFKDPVPAWVLGPHILLMFLGVMLAIRAGLGALFRPAGLRRLSEAALWTLGVGGLVIGPAVSGYAFHLPWTGVPFGWDITDNKTLVMWLAWLITWIVLRRRERRRAEVEGGEGEAGAGRLTVLIAAVATVVVYLIPHSL